MRFISIDKIHSGMILGKSIYDTNGTKILSSNQTLTTELVSRITSLGYSGLYIHEDTTDNIEVKDVISEQLKNQAIQSLKNIFVSSPSSDISTYQDEINFLDRKSVV